jgi:protocatechuate 3,4-dioxygenase beta subunit
LRGWSRTDQRGEYSFRTIRPGAYPAGDIPEHVHMHVIEPGRATYYIDDLVFSDDSLLTARHRQVMRGRGGDGSSAPRRDENGVWHVRRDIILGLNIPGY